MWAGGRFGFNGSLHIGRHVTKHSVIKNVAHKVGSTGALCFVTVRPALAEVDATPAIWEEHANVYREDPTPDATPRETTSVGLDWQHSETVTPSEVMLFRYSALTFNGHRIHYDRDYARDIEGHKGLVVHGPLIATLLLDLAQRVSNNAAPKSFEFRAASPLFDTAPFTLHAQSSGTRIDLAAATPQGDFAMQAHAIF
jgi:3-methylfumaryl-CoA hydratase